MPQRRQTVQSARLTEHSDREFLANIYAARGPDGWATTTEIARACGFTGNGDKSQTPAVKVASRLSWMRTGKMIESTDPDLSIPYREPGDRDMRWRLTPLGEAIRAGRLSKAVSNAIAKMDAGELMLLMRELTRTGYIEGDDGTAFALRREYQFNTAQRKLVIVHGRR